MTIIEERYFWENTLIRLIYLISISYSTNINLWSIIFSMRTFDHIHKSPWWQDIHKCRGRRGRDRMVVEFTTTYYRSLFVLLSCFGHCVVCPSSIYVFWLPLWYLRFTASDYPFDIFWPLFCLSFELRVLITPLVSFGHCFVCPSSYGFWLPFGIFCLPLIKCGSYNITEKLLKVVINTKAPLMISKTLVYHRDISSFIFLKDCYDSVQHIHPFINGQQNV